MNIKQIKFLFKNRRQILRQYYLWFRYKVSHIRPNRKGSPATTVQRNFYNAYLKDKNAQYNVMTTCSFYHGQLNVDLYEKAINTISLCDSIFNSTFMIKNGEVTQVDEKKHSHKINVIELPDTTDDITIKRICLEVADKRFDLSKLPLFRITIVKVGEHRLRIIYCFHHIILDGYSLYKFQQRVTKCYNELYKGGNHIAKKNRYEFKDYAMIESLNSQMMDTKKIEFWKNYFKKVQKLEMPHLNSIEKNSNTAKNISRLISRQYFSDLVQLKKQYGVTLNIVTFSIFFLLMHKHTTNTVLTIIIPRFARFHHHNKEMLGPMLNVLPVVCEFKQGMSFIDLMLKVKDTVNLMITNDHQAFDTLVEQINQNSELKLGKEHFEIIFNFVSMEWRESNAPEKLHFVREQLLTTETANLMTFYMVGDIKSQGVDIQMTYQNQRLSDDMAEKMLEQYINLVEQICANPNMPISDYVLDHTKDKQETTQESQKFTPSLTVLDMFLKTVEQFGNNTAISTVNKKHTYLDLFHSALKIHYKLQEIDSTDKRPIIIYGVRNIDFYAAMVACMMAELPFCLLDVHSSIETIQLRCKLLNANLALKSGASKETELTAVKLSKNNIISISTDYLPNLSSLISAEEMRKKSPNINSKIPAYIMFTSGSTGEPKMILGTQKGLAHFINWQIETFHLTSLDRCAQITNCHFDVILREIFSPLCSGGDLVVPEDYRIIASAQFFHWVDRENITYYHIVPSIMKSIVKQDNDLVATMLPSMRYIFFAGEPLSSFTVNRLKTLFYDPGTLVNLYGPSETTLAKCYYIIPNKYVETKTIPIGKPMYGCEAKILSKYGKPCGVGEVGFIHLKTTFATQGYEDKLYNTGDYGLTTADGNIQILGRNDDVIKINGVKVRPTEIAQILNDLPYIKDAHIVLIRDKNDQNTLAAHISLQNNNIAVDSLLNKINSDLSNKVPNNLIPSYVNLMDQLPRLASGKLDKQRLNAINLDDMNLLKGNEYAAPKTDVEIKIHDIWCKVFRKDKISIDDLFTRVGGTSLSGLRVCMMIMDQLGISIDHADFEANQTIRLLAALSSKRSANQTTKASIIDKITIKELLTHAKLPDINPTNEILPQSDKIKHIFLTGATGFVGSYLLESLLNNDPTVKIHCLIRSSNSAEGLEYLLKTAQNYQVDLSALKDRIIVVPGNLSLKKFGLSEHDYVQLSETTDLIVHCGALVNFIYRFDKLAAPNIEGTRSIVSLATDGKRKPIHYISTIGIFPASKKTHTVAITEKDSIYFGDDVELYGGYAQTKWVAESIIQQARESGIPINIYRLGRISGHSITGFWPKHDFVYAFLNSCIDMKMLPNLPISFDMLPVDICATLISKICLNKPFDSTTYNLVNDKLIKISDLANMLHNNGYDTQLAPYEEWHKMLVQLSYSGAPVPLAPFVDLFPEDVGAMPRLVYDRKFDNSNLKSMHAITQTDLPELNAELLSKYIENNS